MGKIKKITSGLLSSVLLFASYGVLADFDDVQTSDWFYTSVTNAEKVGIISGKSDNKFDPQANLTVAEAITLTAKTRAYYNKETEELDGKQSSGHWVQKYADYIKNQGISSTDFSSLYDTSITRGMMADLFAYALPDEEYENKRDFSTAPEQTDNQNVKKLYESGIMSGDEEGFRLNDNITRAEVSALIDRLINPEDRDFNIDDTATSAEGTQRLGIYSCIIPADIGLIETNPKTWYVSAKKVSSTPKDGYNQINVTYNHTYGCQTQEEYDTVINTIQQAYAAVQDTSRELSISEKIAQLDYNKDIEAIKNGTYVSSLTGSKPLFESVNGDTKKIEDIYNTINTFGAIKLYIEENYTFPQNLTNTANGTSAYDMLCSSEHVTCEGQAQYDIAIWDVMGFNSSIWGSTQRNHAESAIEFYGQWFTPFPGYYSGFELAEPIKNMYSDFQMDVVPTNSEYNSDYGMGYLYY